MNGVKYDAEKRLKAGKAAVLRIVVAVYIAYLAFKIAAAKDTSMSLAASRIIGAVFFAAAAAFAVYAVRRYMSEIKAAKICDEAPEKALDDADENTAEQ